MHGTCICDMFYSRGTGVYFTIICLQYLSSKEVIHIGKMRSNEADAIKHMTSVFPRAEDMVVEYAGELIRSELRSYSRKDCIMKRTSAEDLEDFTLQVTFRMLKAPLSFPVFIAHFFTLCPSITCNLLIHNDNADSNTNVMK